MTWEIQKGISKALIIGQFPAQDDDPSQPLTGRSGHKLASLMGISFEEYLCMFDRANILNEWPGVKFPLEDARRSARDLYDKYLGISSCVYDWVLLIGRGVEHIIYPGKPGSWMRWELIMPQAMHIAVLPHLSGVNRWWNNADNVLSAERFLRDWRVQIDKQRTEANILDRGAAD